MEQHADLRRERPDWPWLCKKRRAPSLQGETKGRPPDVTICSSRNIHNANLPTQYGNYNQLVIRNLSMK